MSQHSSIIHKPSRTCNIIHVDVFPSSHWHAISVVNTLTRSESAPRSPTWSENEQCEGDWCQAETDEAEHAQGPRRCERAERWNNEEWKGSSKSDAQRCGNGKRGECASSRVSVEEVGD